MLSIHLITVGKLKESFYQEACQEYVKRLGAFCKFTHSQISEEKLPQHPSPKEVEKALEKEGAQILEKIPSNAYLIPLCVEGRNLDSRELAQKIDQVTQGSPRHLAFVIGGSYGLAPAVKEAGDLRLSMSPMTFPHHLARVMLLEQIYRGFQILEQSPYHK